MDSRTATAGGRKVAPAWLSLAAALVVLVGPSGGTTASSVVYLVGSIGAAVLAWLGVRQCRPGPAARWVAVTVSCNAIGDLL